MIDSAVFCNLVFVFTLTYIVVQLNVPLFTNPDRTKRTCFNAKMLLWFAGVYFLLVSLAYWVNHGWEEKQEEG